MNPAVAAHGGRVTLVDVTDGRVRLRLEGGCQGCSLAEVTVRQGSRHCSGIASRKSRRWSTSRITRPGRRRTSRRASADAGTVHGRRTRGYMGQMPHQRRVSSR
ncbi:MAG: NifU family protein [Candidatus Rokubacteria bacterium]|nr:NifU family protein [Candidatus Rokubacteria bacterium]